MLYYIFEKLPFIRKQSSKEKHKRIFYLIVTVYTLLLSYSFSSFGEQNKVVYNNKNYLFIPLSIDLLLLGYKYVFGKKKEVNKNIKNELNIHPFHQMHSIPSLQQSQPLISPPKSSTQEVTEIKESSEELKSKDKTIENSIFSKSSSTPLLNDDDDDFDEENKFEENTDNESEELKTFDLPIYQKNKKIDPNELGNDLPSYHRVKY